jgi:hypothetical protein
MGIFSLDLVLTRPKIERTISSLFDAMSLCLYFIFFTPRHPLRRHESLSLLYLLHAATGRAPMDALSGGWWHIQGQQHEGVAWGRGHQRQTHQEGQGRNHGKQGQG